MSMKRVEYIEGQSIFPEESMLDGNPNCINKEWILNKWTEMITDCVDINNAEILV